MAVPLRIATNDVQDVTDWGAQLCLILTCPVTYVACIPGFIGRKTITFTPNGIRYHSTCLGICDKENFVPDTDLASVEKVNCLCCVGLASKLTNQAPLCIGNGMDSKRVDALVDKIKKNYKEYGEVKIRSVVQNNNRILQQLQQQMQHLVHRIKIPVVHTMTRSPS